MSKINGNLEDVDLVVRTTGELGKRDRNPDSAARNHARCKHLARAKNM